MCKMIADVSLKLIVFGTTTLTLSNAHPHTLTMRSSRRKITPPAQHPFSNLYPTPDNTPGHQLWVPRDSAMSSPPGIIPAEAGSLALCPGKPADSDDAFLPPCIRSFNAPSIVPSSDILSGVSAIRQQYPESFLLFTHLPPGLYSALISSRGRLPYPKCDPIVNYESKR